MAGLIVIALALVWLFIAAAFARGSRSGSDAHQRSRTVRVTVFICIALLPFVDEIIGRVQYQWLCSTEAKVWVHPDAAKVVAARNASRFERRTWLAIPVREQISEYVDAATGEPFLRVTAFHTPGGFVMRAGLNMGNSTSCWPDHWTEPYRTLRLDELLKQGKM